MSNPRPKLAPLALQIPPEYLCEVTAEALRKYEYDLVMSFAGLGFTDKQLTKQLETARLIGAAVIALQKAADAIDAYEPPQA